MDKIFDRKSDRRRNMLDVQVEFCLKVKVILTESAASQYLESESLTFEIELDRK